MGTVHLTQSHHGLHIRVADASKCKRVLLTPQLLARPIFNGRSALEGPGRHAIKGALQGLMRLPNFNTAISFSVVNIDGVEHISLPYRVWGEISLGPSTNIILGFSHDTRDERRDFFDLLDWLENDTLVDLDSKQFDPVTSGLNFSKPVFKKKLLRCALKSKDYAMLPIALRLRRIPLKVLYAYL
jgi:hypothetical protein